MKRISCIYTVALLVSICITLDAQGPDVPKAIAVSPSGITYISGTSLNQTGQMEIVLSAFDKQGNRIGTEHHFSDASGPSSPTALAFSGDNILISCTSPTASTGQDIVVLSYPQVLLSAQTPGSLPGSLTLEQSYPNPLKQSDATLIRYGIPEQAHVQVTVTDISGREIKQLVNREVEAGMHEVEFRPGSLPAGTYFYTLRTSKSSEVRKLLLVR